MQQETRKGRAWRETKARLNWLETLIGGAIAGGTTYGALLTFASEEAAMEEVIAVSVGLAVGLFVMPLAQFVWNWCRAPLRMANEEIVFLRAKLEKYEPQDRRAVRLSDALYWIVDHSVWADSPPRERPERVLPASVELRQAARDGEITIRGRRQLSGSTFDLTWEDIPADYWNTHQLDVSEIMVSGAHLARPETEPLHIGDLSPRSKPRFSMLRVWKDQLEAKWPEEDT